MEIPTPDELQKQQESEDNVFYERAIKHLTGRMRKGFELSNPQVVSTSISFNMIPSHRIQKRVVIAFAKKGWQISFSKKLISDQRDGDYYDVKIIPSRNAY